MRYEVDGWGVAELCTDGGRVLWHELPRPARADGERREGERRSESAYPRPGWGKNPKPTAPTLAGASARNGDNFAPTLVARLRGYFAGAEEDFADVSIDLGDLTPYGQALARTLRDVPRGDVVTYGELAALAGRPGAARAAGTFCAQNRFGVLVPCHRVVGASGLGGYGSLGSDYKRRLLALERVAL